MNNPIDKKDNINTFKNKNEFYSNLQKYNKVIQNQNQKKLTNINSEIKIFQKPSALQNNKKSEKDNLLTEISRQKNNSKDLDLNEIELQPNRTHIIQEKNKNKE